MSQSGGAGAPPEGAAGHRGVVWDEENIRLTYHPADKDYGHMKIDEPDTPFEHRVAPDEDEAADGESMPSFSLEAPVTAAGKPEPPPAEQNKEPDEWTEDDREDKKKDRVVERPTGKPVSKDFAKHRKDHYNMKAAMERAKRLMEEEDDEN